MIFDARMIHSKGEKDTKMMFVFQASNAAGYSQSGVTLATGDIRGMFGQYNFPPLEYFILLSTDLWFCLVFKLEIYKNSPFSFRNWGLCHLSY